LARDHPLPQLVCPLEDLEDLRVPVELLQPNQFSGLSHLTGMYLQTIMLLLREEGLASCPQEAGSLYHGTVDEVVQPSEGLMLFSGMSIGYENTAASGVLFIDRVPLAETVEFVGWED